MSGKPNLPVDADERRDIMGSSLRKHGTALDQERAASMADEGGAAGAVMDTIEQRTSFSGPGEDNGSWKRWAIFGGVGALCGLAVGLGIFARD